MKIDFSCNISSFVHPLSTYEVFNGSLYLLGYTHLFVYSICLLLLLVCTIITYIVNYVSDFKPSFGQSLKYAQLAYTRRDLPVTLGMPNSMQKESCLAPGHWHLLSLV